MRYIISLMLVALLASPVYAAKAKAENADSEKPTAEKTAAETQPAGGFEGPVSGAKAQTVENALKLPQDSPVLLTGHIESSVAGEKNQYIFKDATGEIKITIPPRQFKGQIVRPETKIQISGKIDKQANNPDATRLKVNKLKILP